MPKALCSAVGRFREKAASLSGLWLRSGSGRLPMNSQLLPADCAQLLKGNEATLWLLLFYKWGRWGIERFISLSVLSISLWHCGEPERYILSSWEFARLVRKTELPQAHEITPCLRKGASLGEREFQGGWGIEVFEWGRGGGGSLFWNVTSLNLRL